MKLGQEITPSSVAWADQVAALYEEQLLASEPFPPKMDDALLMQMPVGGIDALDDSGYELEPDSVWLYPQPHKGLGILKIITL